MPPSRPSTDLPAPATPGSGAAPEPGRGVRLQTEIVVIGAGQAGLSAAYHLRRLGVAPVRGFVVLDQAPRPGGAWQFRWPSLTLSTVNRLHDLPGMRFADAIGTGDPGTGDPGTGDPGTGDPGTGDPGTGDPGAADPGAAGAGGEVPAAVAVPAYFAAYERAFALPVYRPVTVRVVCDRGERFVVESDRLDVSARGVINATGTWEAPYVPEIPGADRFRGRQLHTRDYRTAEEFVGRHVVVVGAGISALQLLDEVSRVTTTTWVTRRPPEFRTGPFDEAAGRAAVAMVEDRVRRGLPPASVVSVTGLLVTPAVEAMRARGVLRRLPMFGEITPDGVRWPDGAELRADVILWCTGFRSALDHLAPLMLRGPDGGITMAGRLATQVAKDARVHLVGYGPSASTVGANRAGAAAAAELTAFLGLR